MALFINDAWTIQDSFKGMLYHGIATGIIFTATNEQTFHNSTSK